MPKASKSCGACVHEYPVYTGGGEYLGLWCMAEFMTHGSPCKEYQRGESKYKRAARRWLIECGETGENWVTPAKQETDLITHLKKESHNGFRDPKKKRSR